MKITLRKKYKYGRNLFEDNTYRYLKKKKVNFKYESERIAYILARFYCPDWVIDTINGKLYVETKGHLRREDKAKLIAVKKQHPEVDLRILFYAPNKTNAKWAERHGFRYAFGKIPQEWLNGF